MYVCIYPVGFIFDMFDATRQSSQLTRQIDTLSKFVMTIEQYLTAESTFVEFKESLNTVKPKEWLKTVSAFANTLGGSLIIGITDAKELVGVSDIQAEAAKAAEIINAHIEPVPYYQLLPIHEHGRDYLVMQVAKGTSTP